jgi:hypothetical protein
MKKAFFLWMMAVSAGAVPIDVLELEIREGGIPQRVTVWFGENKIRVDKPREKFAVLYDVAAEQYTGLEQRDYHYWQFSWPEVKAQAEKSRLFKRRLEDRSLEGLSSYDLESRQTESSILPAAALYVWKQTQLKKPLAGKTAQQWIGETRGLERVEVWSVSPVDEPLHAALERLKKVNDPLALAAVRPIVPFYVFPVFDSMKKGEGTPLEIYRGGEGKDRDFLRVIALRKQEGNPEKLFSIPSTYQKVPLSALDDILPAP